jgi:Flp pilus assembly protein TadG
MIRHLLRDRSGIFAVEMALVTPVLVALLLGSMEVGRFIMLHQKLDRAATTMGDLASQPSTLCSADLTNLFPVVSELVAPFWTPGTGVVILSGVVNTTGTTVVAWQQAGAGSYTASSRIGHVGGPATLPKGFTVASGDTVIVSEVLFNFKPLFLTGVVPASVLYHNALYRPRLGSLSTLSTTC